MPKRNIIVIGGSAGAIEPLSSIVAGLPHNLRASVFIVIHTSATRESQLPNVVRRAGRMDARHPTDGESIETGQIYIAPPDRHLILENSRINIVHGPKENRSRPAIDPLFRSAAVNYGPQVIGVILSGSLDDGTAGLRAIKQMGGISIVQDPAEAIYSAMPESAIDHNAIDYVLQASEIAPLLRALVQNEVNQNERGDVAVIDLRREVEMTGQISSPREMVEGVGEIGELSMFTCPECAGTLWEIKDAQLLRYRCHVGHAFSIDSLDAEQSEKVEAALWTALRALEERGELARRMARQSRERERGWIARRYDERAREADQHAESIRQILLADPEQLFKAETENGAVQNEGA